MNREQRRKLNKKHHVNYSAQEWEMIELYAKMRAGDLDVKDLNEFAPSIDTNEESILRHKKFVPEGTLVKLNAEDILSRKTEGVTQKYRDWVESHKDNEFHATWDQSYGTLCCLREDVENCADQLMEGSLDHTPWLWDIHTDLLFEEEGEWKLLEFTKKVDENA